MNSISSNDTTINENTHKMVDCLRYTLSKFLATIEAHLAAGYTASVFPLDCNFFDFFFHSKKFVKKFVDSWPLLGRMEKHCWASEFSVFLKEKRKDKHLQAA